MIPDIINTNYGSTKYISVFLGNTTTVLNPVVFYKILYQNPNFVKTADFNKDGCIDIIYCAIQSCEVLLGNCTGIFSNPILIYEGWPSGMTISDFNNDNMPDVAFTNSDVFNNVISSCPTCNNNY